MSKFEIACVTMHQKDFSKISEMNIHTNVIFANQCDRTDYIETEINGCKARMISTTTRGVGINRNLALTYAEGDIVLFADDDVTYIDNLEEIILAEFEAHPDADIFIFHLDTNSERKQRKYSKTRKCYKFERMPWGGVRVAVRLNAQRRANLWFTTLFGGGCLFPSGEDSMWLVEAKRKGLNFYVSKETIGIVSFDKSTWFTGYDEKYYYGKGAFYAAMHKKSYFLWMLYFALKTKKLSNLTIKKILKLMQQGKKDYYQINVLGRQG